MTRLKRMLAGGGLAAVLGVMMLALSGALGVREASAESPPNPPSRFAGSVLVDGANPAAGTVIEARIGSASCGSTSVFNQGTEARYVLDVPGLNPAATPNCGTDGAQISFYIGGKLAKETGSWDNGNLSILNLTYVTPPPVTPTPKPPVTGTGTGTQSGSDTTLWLFVALGLGALAFGAGGMAVARRRS
jgi:hypothetical protein